MIKACLQEIYLMYMIVYYSFLELPSLCRHSHGVCFVICAALYIWFIINSCSDSKTKIVERRVYLLVKILVATVYTCILNITFNFLAF